MIDTKELRKRYIGKPEYLIIHGLCDELDYRDRQLKDMIDSKLTLIDERAKLIEVLKAARGIGVKKINVTEDCAYIVFESQSEAMTMQEDLWGAVIDAVESCSEIDKGEPDAES
jgi:hypothetical protein